MTFFRLMFGDRRHPLLWGGILSVSVIVGCSSSGTTGGNSGQSNPPSGISQVSPSQLPGENNGPGSRNKKQQGFVTQEDTIEAHLVTRKAPHESSHPSRQVKKSYTVQIGAFRMFSNADHCLKLIRKRMPYSALNFYDKAIKMYRVTVGRFTKKGEAFDFRKSLKKNFPKDYKDCWVVEMKQ